MWALELKIDANTTMAKKNAQVHGKINSGFLKFKNFSLDVGEGLRCRKGDLMRNFGPPQLDFTMVLLAAEDKGFERSSNPLSELRSHFPLSSIAGVIKNFKNQISQQGQNAVTIILALL